VVIANLKKDPEKVRDIQMVLDNLREGWKTLTQKASKPEGSTLTGGIRITG